MTPPVVFFHSFPLPVTHVFFFAVLLRNQSRTTAEPRRCDCGHDDPIELPLRFDGGATAIIGGRTAVLAVALRCQGGFMTSARRLNMGCGFRSYYRFRRCRGRCYYPRHTGGAVPLRCLYDINRSGTAMIAVVPSLIAVAPRKTVKTADLGGGTVETLNMFKTSAIPPRAWPIRSGIAATPP